MRKINEVNSVRKRTAPSRQFNGSSYNDKELKVSSELSVEYIIAPPRMAKYIEYSTKIYNVYLKYIAPEDIHIYSIDEVFIDVTGYLNTYKLTARELTMKLIQEVFETTGITATAGIGTNLYLAKIAMDIVSKHVEPDENGVRIAQLDEMSYRKLLWNHRPLTDFWRVGKGYSKKLEKIGLMTMGDIARCSMGKKSDYYNEDLLYKIFGINAELLIDHAWGYEPCTMADIKSYKPSNNSIGSGQVLHCPYDFNKAKLIVREMADLLALDLVDKGLVTDQIVLTVGYDRENLNTADKRKAYKGEVTTDYYGRKVPKHAHGTINLGQKTSSTKDIVKATMELYDRIINKNMLIRRAYIVANHVIDEKSVTTKPAFEQLDLFTDYETVQKQRAADEKEHQDEKNVQKAILDIKKKYGKNAIIKGMNLEDGATTIERNGQIGGHKS